MFFYFSFGNGPIVFHGGDGNGLSFGWIPVAFFFGVPILQSILNRIFLGNASGLNTYVYTDRGWMPLATGEGAVPVSSSPLSILSHLASFSLPLIFSYIYFRVLTARNRGLSYWNAFRDVLQNPFAIPQGFGGAGGGRHQDGRRPVAAPSRAAVAAAVHKLPVEAFATEAEIREAPQHDLIKRCRAAGVSTAGVLERSDLVERLLAAGGTTGASCSICCDDYTSGDLLRVLPCQHRFHVACVDQWAFISCDQGRMPTCPVCTGSLMGAPGGGRGTAATAADERDADANAAG